MMKFLPLVAGLCCSVALAAPNVIVVLTDDQGYGDLSCHGNPHLRTPALDALKQESTSFERFFVSPTCAPTRAALLTGRHEFSVGVSHTITGRSLLRPGVPTVAEVMREAGYDTAIFGKWHLGDAYPCRPEDRGFDEVLVHGSGGIGQAADYWGNAYHNPHLRSRSGWAEKEGYCTDIFFREARQWIRGREGRPFFLWLATNAPHAPFIAPEGSTGRLEAEGLKKPLASFYAMIENIDANVSGLLEELDSLDLAEDTIVVFMTDNGSAMAAWNAGMKGKKGTPHEGGVRVPCFVRWPGRIAAERQVDAPAAHLDLMPTLAGLCGVSLPEGWSGDGVNLSRPLLGDGAFPEERTFFTHVGRWPGDERPERWRTRRFSVRDRRWRLVGLELFDMVADPGQETDVFPSHQEEAGKLLADYGRWWDAVVADVREPVRYVVGDPACPVVRVCSHDWWPSLEAKAGGVYWNHESIRKYLERAAVAKTRNTLPEACGHWKLQVARDGRYRVHMALLPEEASAEERRRIGLLRAGSAHVRVGKREVTMEVVGGASAVALNVDLPEGPANLEAWFGGQLPQERRVGSFYASIERVGDMQEVVPDIRIESEK